jgi:hypothetical protein
MHTFLRRIWHTSIIGNLVTGSLVILPFVLTVLIIGWGVTWLVGAFGPGTWFGDILSAVARRSSGRNVNTPPF